MNRIVLAKFKEWTRGKNSLEARVSVYNSIRDIPYAIIPELIDPKKYAKIFAAGKGSCTPKHLLLCQMYQMLDITVLYACYPFLWDEIEIDYPAILRRLAKAIPTSYHVACKVEIGGDLVLVDATLDPFLELLGLPVNKVWDGISDTLLPIVPCGEEQLYHPCETSFVKPRLDDKSLAFYKELNLWLAKVRRSFSDK
jgi:hypothetical protein